MANDSPRQLRRREKLRDLLPTPGAQADLARGINTPTSHLSAILAGRRGLGDQLAKKIEGHFEKPAGWLDQDPDAWPFSDELHARVRQLPEVGRVALEYAMWAHFGEVAPAHVSELLRKLRAGFQAMSTAVVPDSSLEKVTSQPRFTKQQR